VTLLRKATARRCKGVVVTEVVDLRRQLSNLREEVQRSLAL